MIRRGGLPRKQTEFMIQEAYQGVSLRFVLRKEVWEEARLDK